MLPIKVNQGNRTYPLTGGGLVCLIFWFRVLSFSKHNIYCPQIKFDFNDYLYKMPFNLKNIILWKYLNQLIFETVKDQSLKAQL